MWKINSWLLSLLSAIITSSLGYWINQLPEFPNKAENSKYIILAVVFTTGAVWIITTLQNQSAASHNNPRTVVRNNWLIGKGNKLVATQQDVEIRKNLIIGDGQEVKIDAPNIQPKGDR